MKPSTPQVLLLAGALVCGPAMAQHAPALPSSPLPATAPPGASATAAGAPKVQRAGGIEYVNGGIGEESRAALQALQPEFPLRLVFSTRGGEYFVADTVTVGDDRGQLLALPSVGPILMLKLPPGDYTVNAIYSGRTEQKQIKVGHAAQTVNWRW